MKYSIFLFCLVFFSALCSCRSHSYPDCIRGPETGLRSGGCGDIFVYQMLDNKTAVRVEIDRDIVSLSERCTAFCLDDSPPGVEVILAVAGDDPDAVYFNYCSDTLPPDAEYLIPQRCPCDSGTVTVSVSGGGEASSNSTYRASVRLEGVRACCPGQTQRIIDTVIMRDVTVGWIPG